MYTFTTFKSRKIEFITIPDAKHFQRRMKTILDIDNGGVSLISVHFRQGLQSELSAALT